MKKNYNNDWFIDKSKIIHRDNYDYSLVEYIKSTIPVKIICKYHGVFEQLPQNHLKGKGCKYCANNVKLTDEIKNKYCESKNIKLIRIRYDEDINEILRENLKII